MKNAHETTTACEIKDADPVSPKQEILASFFRFNAELFVTPIPLAINMEYTKRDGVCKVFLMYTISRALLLSALFDSDDNKDGLIFKSRAVQGNATTLSLQYFRVVEIGASCSS